MSDKKISELPVLSAPAGEDLLLVVDNPNGTPESKAVSLSILFGNINWNVSITNLTVSSTGFRLSAKHTPANSAATMASGTIFFDDNYLYVTTSNNIIKRIALTNF